jgi:hypothetical protein
LYNTNNFVLQNKLYCRKNDMNNELKLKELERKAFRSTYQDGLWDIYMGLIVIFMAVFIFRPDEGYRPWNLVLMVASFVLAYLVFWAGKKFVTVPRMGQVTFGSRRKKRKRTLAIIMGVIIVIHAGFGAWLSTWLGGGSMERILVASIGSLFVGPPMIIAAFFTDFLRGYYIAILMAGAVFLMILLNQPLYPVVIGLLILAPGVVLFVRFMRRYPLHREGEDHD